MKRAITIGKTTDPYSPAVVTTRQKTIYVSGQIATEVEADVQTQTRQVLQKIENILGEEEAFLSDIIKTTVFLIDINDFPKVNEVYSQSFPMDPPARSTVQVVALPMGAHIMIDAIAVRD
ncbi:MAG: hypothetical protein JSV04_13335 [Candidatus Heimdallarchaeota archaeon]|nr:MAG: hypothetical protein JSV04_13335 [Candidatus Heimdallarchaeota archaeon]